MRSTMMVLGAALGLALSGCGGGKGEAPVDAGNAAAERDADAVAAVPEYATPDAAAEIMRSYAALAEKHDFTGAADYWSDSGAAAQFAADLEDYPKVVMAIGKPSDTEGAAGSSMIKVPVAMTMTLRSGSPYDMGCTATLRRVNDVPGATPKQLRWNIQSIDC